MLSSSLSNRGIGKMAEKNLALKLWENSMCLQLDNSGQMCIKS